MLSFANYILALKEGFDKFKQQEFFGPNDSTAVLNEDDNNKDDSGERQGKPKKGIGSLTKSLNQLKELISKYKNAQGSTADTLWNEFTNFRDDVAKLVIAKGDPKKAITFYIDYFNLDRGKENNVGVRWSAGESILLKDLDSAFTYYKKAYKQKEGGFSPWPKFEDQIIKTRGSGFSDRDNNMFLYANWNYPKQPWKKFEEGMKDYPFLAIQYLKKVVSTFKSTGTPYKPVENALLNGRFASKFDQSVGILSYVRVWLKRRWKEGEAALKELPNQSRVDYVNTLIQYASAEEKAKYKLPDLKATNYEKTEWFTSVTK